MLQIENLSKKFNDLLAVDHISFQVNPGEIFGFLGPNGAGKTTTINCICGLLKPDTGSIRIDNEEITSSGTKIRKKLGVVPQEVALYEELNAIENMRFWGGLYGMKGKQLKERIDKLIDLAGLKERAKDRVKMYSSGMKRRLNMAAGLIHQPKLLLLDEPTVGIDPQARHQMLETVRGIARNGTTILYRSRIFPYYPFRKTRWFTVCLCNIPPVNFLKNACPPDSKSIIWRSKNRASIRSLSSSQEGN
jgi:ABC-2 type transport system ATP-binding protein